MFIYLCTSPTKTQIAITNATQQARVSNVRYTATSRICKIQKRSKKTTTKYCAFNFNTKIKFISTLDSSVWTETQNTCIDVFTAKNILYDSIQYIILENILSGVTASNGIH